jgi:peptidyl-prolyl cis-trans isomerase D
MLEYIRNKSSSKFASIILIIMALAMGLWGVQSFFTSNNNSNNIANVSGRIITKEQLSKSLQNIKLKYAANDWQNIQNNDQKRLFLRKQLLASLVYQAGIESAFKKYKYDVADLQIQSFLRNLPLFKLDNHFDIHRYQLVLQQMGVSEDDFIKDVKYSLILNQLKDTFKISGFILDSEKDNYNLILNKNLKIRYLEINPNQLKANIDKNKLLSFYNANKKLFSIASSWNVNYIYIPFELLKNRVKITDEAVRDYYNTHKNNYIEPKKVKFNTFILSKNGTLTKDAILAKLPKIKIDGIEDLKKIIAKDNWSLETKKDENWHFVNSSPILRELNANLPINSISKFIKLDNNSYIAIQVTAVNKAQNLSFDAVAKEIKNLLIQQKYSQEISELNDKLATLVYTNPENLLEASKFFMVDVKNINIKDAVFFKNNDSVKQYLNNLSNEQVGQNSDIFILDEGWLVINPKEFIPSKTKSFFESKEQVTQLLQKKLKEELAISIAKKITTSLDEDVIHKYNLSWKVINNLTINSKYDSLFLAKALSLSTNELIFYKDQDDKFIVIQNLDKLNSTKSSINEQALDSSIGELEFELFTKGLLNGSKVKLLINDNDLSLIN